MKHWNTNTYLISILLFWACCKDKESQKTTINPLFGKIRHIFEYSDSLTDIQRYFYLYDSTSGELQKIILKSHLISDSSILWMTFNKQNDTTLLVNYLPEYPQHENYKIILHLKQIKKIYQYDTISYDYNPMTTIHTSNNMVDSIYDTGLIQNFASDIKYNNFIYDNDNCIKYNINWIQQITGIPVYRIELDSFNFTTVENIHAFPIQNNYYFGTIFSFLSYHLQVAGYYYLTPNKHLVNEKHTISINNSISSTKYEYSIVNQYIKKLTLTDMLNGEKRYSDIAYYGVE